MTYTGHVIPGGPTRHPAARPRDHPQDVGQRDAQQRLPGHLRGHRRAAAHRRRRRPAPLPAARARGHRRGSTTWSPPTSTGTTCGRSRRWRGRPAPRRTPVPTTPTRCPWRPTCGCARRRGDRRRARARRHPPARAHPRLGGAVVRATPTASPTCSPATRSSPAAWATPRTPGRASTRCTPTSIERVFDRLRRRHLVLPRPRRRLHARRRAPAPRGVARARLVTPGP